MKTFEVNIGCVCEFLASKELFIKSCLRILNFVVVKRAGSQDFSSRFIKTGQEELLIIVDFEEVGNAIYVVLTGSWTLYPHGFLCKIIFK